MPHRIFPVRNEQQQTTCLFDNENPHNSVDSETILTLCGQVIPNGPFRVADLFCDESLICDKCVDAENAQAN
jgi:hypothetical protein